MLQSERIKELEEQIRYHNDLYFNKKPEITDAEFDLLVEELKKLNPTSSVLEEIGAYPSYGRKVKHDIIMGSLEKVTFEKDEKGEIKGDGMSLLEEWYANRCKTLKKKISEVEIGWSMKIDGCAVELIYRNGKLVNASTRGNGKEGMDITDNVRNIESIPTVIDKKSLKEVIDIDNCELRIRGEMYLPRSIFKEKWIGVFANPRNAVSGGLMCKDPEQTKKYGFKFLTYELFINNIEPEIDLLKSYYINNLYGYHGIKTAKFEFVKINEGKLNRKLIDKIDAQRASYDFETDGIVISFLSKKDRDILGWNGMCPKGRVAFKFLPEQKKTVIRDITWQVGRTGKITPVAELVPVHIAGSLVSRCTLHNISEIKRLGISIGAEVLIQKAGDIIPQIVRVTQKSKDNNINYPEQCPICGEFTSNDGINIWCDNMNCDSKLHQRILHFLNVLEIKEVGTVMVQSLIENKYIQKIEDLYKLEIEDIMNLPHAGLKTAETVTNAILEKNQIELDKFLYALGIRNLGETTAKNIAKEFKTLDRIKRLEIKDLIKIPDIGEVTARNIVEGIAEMKDTINELEQILDILDYEVKEGKLTGKKFCCTGKLSIKRKELQKLIEEAGGEYSSINKDLDYLIVGDGARSHKIDKAKKFGAQILNEDEFLDLIK